MGKAQSQDNMLCIEHRVSLQSFDALDMLSRSNFTKEEGVEITSSPIVTKVPKAKCSYS